MRASNENENTYKDNSRRSSLLAEREGKYTFLPNDKKEMLSIKVEGMETKNDRCTRNKTNNTVTTNPSTTKYGSIDDKTNETLRPPRRRTKSVLSWVSSEVSYGIGDSLNLHLAGIYSICYGHFQTIFQPPGGNFKGVQN